MRYIEISKPMQEPKQLNQSPIISQQFTLIKLSFFWLSLDQLLLTNRMKNHLWCIPHFFLLKIFLIAHFSSNIYLLKNRLIKGWKLQAQNCIFRIKFYTILKLLFCLSYCIGFEMQQAYVNYTYGKFEMLQILYQHPNCSHPNKKQGLIQSLHGRLCRFIQWECFHHSCEHKGHLHNPTEAFLMSSLNSP